MKRVLKNQILIEKRFRPLTVKDTMVEMKETESLVNKVGCDGKNHCNFN